MQWSMLEDAGWIVRYAALNELGDLVHKKNTRMQL